MSLQGCWAVCFKKGAGRGQVKKLQEVGEGHRRRGEQRGRRTGGVEGRRRGRGEREEAEMEKEEEGGKGEEK